MLNNLLRLFISFAFLGVLVYLSKDSIPEIIQAVAMADKGCLFLGLSMCVTACIFLGLRLKMIAEAIQLKISPKDTISIAFIGYFFNNFLPTAVGGDVVKAYCVAKKTGDNTGGFAAILADRLYGLLMFLLLPSIAAIVMKDWLPTVVVHLIYVGLVLGAICVFSILYYGKFKDIRFVVSASAKWKIAAHVMKIYRSLYSVAVHRISAIGVCVLSTCGQLLGIASIYWIVRGLGSEPQVDQLGMYLLMAVPVVNLMGMVPSINGLGVREFGFVYFLGRIISKEDALAVGLIYFSYLLANSLIGGIIYMFRSDLHFDFSFLKRQKRTNVEEVAV